MAIKGGMGDITLTIKVETETGWSLELNEVVDDGEGEDYSNFYDASETLGDMYHRAVAAMLLRQGED